MAEFLTLDPGSIPTGKLHSHLLSICAPRPIAFASTIDSDGNPNLAPFSFFNIFSSNPPVLIFAPNRRVRDNTSKHTIDNLRQVPEVVINVVSHSILEQMNLTSTEYPAGVNEFKKAGFTQLKSDLIKPFRVLESPAQMECRVMEIKPLSNEAGGGQLIICRILRIHINQNVLGEDGLVDYNKIDLVSRMGKAYYNRASGNAVFQVTAPIGNSNIGMDGIPENILKSHILSGNDLGKLGLAKEFPGAEVIAEFLSKEKEGIMKGIVSEEQRHVKAKELLERNDVEGAWRVLMAESI